MTLSKKCWFAAVFLFICLMAIRLIPQWRYLLKIDNNGIVIAEVPVHEANNGLLGADIKTIDIDETNPNRILAIGQQRSYFSTDHGNSWTSLQAHPGIIKSALWSNGRILAVLSTTSSYQLSISEDGGISWQPCKNTPRFSSSTYLQIRRNKKLQPLLIAESLNASQEKTYLLQEADKKIHFNLFPSNTSIDTAYPNKITLQFPRGKISAQAFQAQDGTWAATSSGIFFQKNGSVQWQDRNASLHTPQITMMKKNPTHESEILACDTIGHLFISKDQGKSWAVTPAHEVESAFFLLDNSILAIHFDRTVELLKEGVLTDISPDWNTAVCKSRSRSNNRSTNNQIEEKNFDDFRITPLAETADTVLLLAGSGVMLDRFFENNFSAGSDMFAALATLNDTASSNLMEITPFIYSYDRNTGVWHHIPPETVQNLQPLQNTFDIIAQQDPPVEQNGQISLEKSKITPYRYLGYPIRAMSLKNKSRYLLTSDDALQIGNLNENTQTGIPRVWTLDAIAIARDSLILDSAKNIDVLTPNGFRGGIDQFHIAIQQPSLYRVILYLFYFRYGSVLIFILLCAWYWRTRKQL